MTKQITLAALLVAAIVGGFGSQANAFFCRNYYECQMMRNQQYYARQMEWNRLQIMRSMQSNAYRQPVSQGRPFCITSRDRWGRILTWYWGMCR